MLVVVAEHERADAQLVGDRSRVRERNRRREVVVDEVIGHEHRRVPERFNLACEVGELPARPSLAATDTKPESAVVHGFGP